MEDDSCGDRDVEACGLFGVLRDIDEVIAVFFMNWKQPSALITQKESCASFEGVFLNRKTFLTDFNTANTDALFIEISFNLFKRRVGLIFHIFIGTLIAEHVELFEYFGFFGVWSTAHIDYFLDTKGTGATDDISHIIAFADIMNKQITFRFIILHSRLYSGFIILHNLAIYSGIVVR